MGVVDSGWGGWWIVWGWVVNVVGVGGGWCGGEWWIVWGWVVNGVG